MASMPNLEMSQRGPAVAIISMAQQASPKEQGPVAEAGAEIEQLVQLRRDDARQPIVLSQILLQFGTRGVLEQSRGIGREAFGVCHSHESTPFLQA
jgi:hypothetical protein